MGGEGSIMHMIVSYRNNTALIRKKRLMKGGKNYFRAKKAYRKAAGSEIAFRTATPAERALIRAKIRRESRRETIFLSLIFTLGLSLAIYLTIQLWPDYGKDQYLFSVPASNSEMAEYQFLRSEAGLWMAKGKYYNAVFYYEQAFLIIKKDYLRHSATEFKKDYLEELESANSIEILNRVNGLITKYPGRVELYDFRAEYYTRTNQPLLAKADYDKIEELVRHY